MPNIISYFCCQFNTEIPDEPIENVFNKRVVVDNKNVFPVTRSQLDAREEYKKNIKKLATKILTGKSPVFADLEYETAIKNDTFNYVLEKIKEMEIYLFFFFPAEPFYSKNTGIFDEEGLMRLITFACLEPVNKYWRHCLLMTRKHRRD